MNRKYIIPARILLGLFLIPAPARLQARVVLVVSSQANLEQEIAGNFKQAHAGLLEEYNLRGLEDEARKIGKNLVARPPELLVVIGNLAAKMAKESSPDCPIIYAAASNVQGLELTGERVYGISVQPRAGPILENFKLALPGYRRIGIIYNPNYLEKEIKELEIAGNKAGLVLKPVPVREMKEIPQALNQLLGQVEVYLMLDDPGVLTADTFPFIFVSCYQKKIPIFAASQEMVKNGALAGFAPNPADVGLKMAELARQILQAKNPQLREIYPEGDLYLNARIAAGFNLSFPPQAKKIGSTIE